jgi:predicted transcriptional regulator
MIGKRNKKVVETTPTVEFIPDVETQSAPPVVETQSAPTAPVVESKAKKVRYAPKSVLQDSAIVRLLKPNAKGESSKSKSAERFNRLHKEVQTVAEYIAAHKEAYQSGAMLARNDLRWDLEHGFISIEAPQS